MALNLDKRSNSAPPRPSSGADTKLRRIVCFEVQKSGTCAKGADCAYDHVALSADDKKKPPQPTPKKIVPTIFLFEEPEEFYSVANAKVSRNVNFEGIYFAQ